MRNDTSTDPNAGRIERLHVVIIALAACLAGAIYGLAALGIVVLAGGMRCG